MGDFWWVVGGVQEKSAPLSVVSECFSRVLEGSGAGHEGSSKTYLRAGDMALRRHAGFKFDRGERRSGTCGVLMLRVPTWCSINLVFVSSHKVCAVGEAIFLRRRYSDRGASHVGVRVAPWLEGLGVSMPAHA